MILIFLEDFKLVKIQIPSLNLNIINSSNYLFIALKQHSQWGQIKNFCCYYWNTLRAKQINVTIEHSTLDQINCLPLNLSINMSSKYCFNKKKNYGPEKSFFFQFFKSFFYCFNSNISQQNPSKQIFSNRKKKLILNSQLRIWINKEFRFISTRLSYWNNCCYIFIF